MEGMEARIGEVTNTPGLEAMLEAEEREERRVQENILSSISISNITRWSAKVVVFFFNNWYLFTGH